MEEDGRGRKHQDTIFGARRTDGQGVDALRSRMAQANAIRQAHGFRVPVDKGKRQSTDLRVGILRRPLAPCGKSSRRNHSRRTSLGPAQPPSQPVELAGEQGEGEPEDSAGHLGSFADSDHARPLHRRRPRRDRGSGKVSRCRGIRNGQQSSRGCGLNCG
jgi:hypothetical protein